MKKSRDLRFVIITLVVFAVIVCGYALRSVYLNYTGKLETEYIFRTKENEVVAVDGIVVRDENRNKGGENISILKKAENKVYVPIVSDSASVAKGDTIALAFQNTSQAEAYEKSRELEEKIANLEKLQDQENLSYINVLTLNSEINSAINGYMKIVDSKNLSSLEDAVQNINHKITTKQIATGSKLDFSSSIKKYTKQKNKNDKLIKGMVSVKTSYSGYFISNVDGYESAVDYQSVSDGEITSEQINALLKSKAEVPQDAFGKIIGQHTWYFACNLELTRASNLKKNYYVSVDFPEKGIYNVPMIVEYVSDKAGETVSVVLKCTLMNEELANLRREKAEITIKSYDGYKISNEALSVNDDGLTGVYVLNGRQVVFKPIRILYNARDYVIADSFIFYDAQGNVDYERTDAYPNVKEFDKVILKGRNLENGKVID